MKEPSIQKMILELPQHEKISSELYEEKDAPVHATL